jgi:hypothetical protein
MMSSDVINCDLWTNRLSARPRVTYIKGCRGGKPPAINAGVVAGLISRFHSSRLSRKSFLFQRRRLFGLSLKAPAFPPGHAPAYCADYKDVLAQGKDHRLSKVRTFDIQKIFEATDA